MSEREISIYCHDNFLRHIPSLCEQMNGGYRKSQEVGVILGSRNTQDGMQLALQQQQQHSMMMTLNQLRQIEQQRMTMLQQLMEQEQRMMIQSHQFQQGGSHPGALLVGQAGRVGGASMIGNSNMIGLNDNPSSLFGRNLDNFVNNSSTQGLNRISQGLMPNLPNRDMDFILGALSSTSNVAGKPFTTNNANNPGEKYQPNSQFFCNNSSPNTGSDSG